jgi:hypothetical protein
MDLQQVVDVMKNEGEVQVLDCSMQLLVLSFNDWLAVSHGFSFIVWFFVRHSRTMRL